MSWAIATGAGGFIGRYWADPKSAAVFRVQIFESRKDAREFMRLEVKPHGGYHAYPHAAVVRVQIVTTTAA